MNENDVTEFLQETPDPVKERQEILFRMRIKDQMATRQGRAFVNNLLDYTGFFDVPLSSEPYFIGYNEGQRNIGRWIHSTLNELCFEQYILMLKESREDKQNDDRESNTSNGNNGN
jgi:hypothetical protein